MPYEACVPDPDPGELFADIDMQLSGRCTGARPRR